MHADTPYCVEARHSSDRCVRLQDGRFHLVRPGPLCHLFHGSEYILASEALADVLRETCADCLDLRRTEVIQVVTGEIFGIYYEVSPHDEFTPADVGRVHASGFHAWHFHRTDLFVSPKVAETISQRGFDDISFSQEFSRFAGAVA